MRRTGLPDGTIPNDNLATGDGWVTDDSGAKPGRVSLDRRLARWGEAATIDEVSQPVGRPPSILWLQQRQQRRGGDGAI